MQSEKSCMCFKTRRASTRDYMVTENQEHPKTTVVEVYNNGENIDKDDENVDDTYEHPKLAISSKQIIEGTNQLPGQV